MSVTDHHCMATTTAILQAYSCSICSALLRVGLEEEPELSHDAGTPVLRDAEIRQVLGVDALVGQRRPLHLQQLPADLRLGDQSGRGELLWFRTTPHHLRCRFRRWLRGCSVLLDGKDRLWNREADSLIGITL